MFRLPSHTWRRCGPALAIAAAVGWLAGWPVALPVALAADADSEQAVAVGPDEGQPPAGRLGMLVRVELPVTDRTVRRVRGFIDRALARAKEKQQVPVLIFEFRMGKEGEKSAAAGEFIGALDLARTIASEKLSSVDTVAYVPEKLVGHAVLAAIACGDIVMPAEARLGPVGAKPGEIGPTERSAYDEIARRRRTVPAPVAGWFLDPSQRVLKVETPVSREFVSEEKLEELRQRQPIRSADALEDLIEGKPGELTGAEARRFGLVSYQPLERAAVAKALGLPPEAMQEDPTLIGEVRAVRIDLKGPVRSALVHQLQRQIQDEVRENEVDFICVWVDSAGGVPAESIELARTLAGLSSDVRTVAYVPSQARGDAALVALACGQLVMNPAAELGGSGNYELEPRDVPYVREAIEGRDGPWGHRSWSLVAALIDPNLDVFRCTRLDEVGYFSDAEREALNEKLRRADPDAKLWQKGAAQITTPGKPLLLDGRRALEYGLASTTVESFAELKQHFGLEDDPTLLAPGWADFLVDALSSWAGTTVLLIIAFAALYIELTTPGIGVGGFTAAVCFLLFFWANHLGGTAEWLEVLLFVAGIGCLLLEVFVIPGFGIFGLGGGALVLASLVLASQTFVLPRNPYQMAELRRSLLSLAGAGVGIAVLVALARRWLPSTPVYREMVVTPPEGEEAEMIRRRESLLDLDNSFIGTRGTTSTQLTPSGKARFGDLLLDVITDGDVVPRGSTIEVVEIQGNRVLVRQVT